jgi:hemolysin activation/secretion protein
MRIAVPFRPRLAILLALGCLASVAGPGVPGAGGRDAMAQAPLAAPPGTPVPRMLPTPALPGVAPEAAPAAPGVLPAEPAGVVAIATAAIAGTTVFPPARLAPFLAELTGPAVPVARITAARDRLLALYRSEGYVFSAVRAVLDPGPAGTALTLQVTEGHIAEVLLDGDVGPSGVQVLRFLNRLTALKPIDIATLERHLLLVQDIPGISVRAVLRPANGEAGALQLVAQVTRSAFDGFLTADNRGPRFSGPEQAIGVFGLNSFTSWGERTEVLAYYSSGGTLRFGQAGFETFLGGSGLKLRAYLGGGDSAPSEELRLLGYAGATRVFGAALTYPILRRRAYSLFAVGAFDGYDNKVEVGEDNPERVSDDQLRIFRGGFDGVLLDTLAGASRSATNSASLRISRGVAGLGSKRNDNPLPGRQESVVDFLKISGELSRTQTLLSFGEASSVALQATVGAQWTDDVLPPSEKFFFGGTRFGRGFYNGEITGDRAIAGSLELQFTSLADAALPDATRPIGYQFYGFYDLGQSFEVQPDDINRRITSFGGGIRVTFTDNVQGAFEAARRLTLDPQRSGDADEELKRWAGYWRLLVRF